MSQTLAEARAAAGVQIARLSDGDTAYRVEGSRGPWVVLIHGLITPMYSWDALSSALVTAGFRVLRYDHLGRGLSDRPRLRYDPALYTRQLVELLRAVSIDATHVIGWSMGCIIGARLALELPDAVHRLVMVAPGMFIEPSLLVRALSRLPLVGPRVIARNAPRVIARLPAEHLEQPARFPDYAARMRDQLAFPGLGEAFASTVLNYPWQAGPELAEVGRHPRPVQLIWGDDDPATPYRNAARVREVFPRAELVTVRGGRHAPHVEHPGRVHPALLEFLRRDAFASIDAPAAPRADAVV
jgi:pimeloyl-ACP methyl ester carboxylesterase